MANPFHKGVATQGATAARRLPNPFFQRFLPHAGSQHFPPALASEISPPFVQFQTSIERVLSAVRRTDRVSLHIGQTQSEQPIKTSA
jgi:hypothetical protein